MEVIHGLSEKDSKVSVGWKPPCDPYFYPHPHGSRCQGAGMFSGLGVRSGYTLNLYPEQPNQQRITMCRFCNKHWPTGGLSTYAMPSPSYEKNSNASRKKKVVRLGTLRNS